MIELVKKNNYWYLSYSYKENNKTNNFDKYLGKEVPKNILLLKEEFTQEVFRNRFENKVNSIKKNFNKEFQEMPKFAQEKYLSQFSIKFTYNSQAIEGSTLNLKDTALLIEKGISPEKKFTDIELSRTHYEVFLEILNEKKDLNLDLILEWHKKLFIKTYPEIAGKIRNHPVKVIGSKAIFSHKDKINENLINFFNWYDKNKKIIHPVRLAALAHLKFVSIHPFTDGNGRISRLLLNYILHLNNLPLLDIDYVKRKSYYNSLEKDQVSGKEEYFVNFIINKYIKEYVDYL